MTVRALAEIGIGVASLGESLRLYRDVLGFEALVEGEIEAETAPLVGTGRGSAAVLLGRPAVAGAARLRLVETSAPPSRPHGDTTALGPLGVGFTCRDIAAAHARLGATGVSFCSPPIELTPEPEEGEIDLTGPRRFEAFGQAANGELVVLIERRNAPDAYGTLDDHWLTSEPLHTSHIVADLAAASRFMVEALEHRVIFRETCQGEDFERLMGLGPGAAFRFEMLQHPEHHTGRIIFIEYLEPAARKTIAAASATGLGRGIQSLRYDTSDLETTLAAVTEAGGELLLEPRDLASAVLGGGRVAVVGSPLGVRLELWQPNERSAS